MREENGQVTRLGVGTSKTNYLETDCDSAIFRNCIFEYIDGKALTLRGSHYGIVENCYFHHINWSGKESVALRTQKAKYCRSLPGIQYLFSTGCCRYPD
jgi:hypothetical protein